jgi:hypothetical protein
MLLCGCMGRFPGKEGGIQVLAGLAPSSQTVGSLLGTPWSALPGGKMLYLEMYVIFC